MELILLGAAAIIPGIVTAVALLYLVTRGLPERRDGFSAAKAFFLYCYFMIGLSTVAAVVGFVMLVNVGCKAAFELDWSRNSLWLAFVVAGMGILVCTMHLAAKRDVRKRTREDLTTPRRVYVTWMAFAFGFAAFVSLTVAVYQLVHYYRATIVPAAPTTETAMAIVLVVVWLYYMFRLRREATRPNRGDVRLAQPEKGGEVGPQTNVQLPGGQ
jgi:Domain of unknown function (DUF5671)